MRRSTRGSGMPTDDDTRPVRLGLVEPGRRQKRPIPGSAIPPEPGRSWPDPVPTAATPAGGEAVSTGGLFRQIVSVFVENKLAVVGLVVIVGMVLFCFVGPFFYHTNQVNAQAALLNSTQNTGPGDGPSPGHRQLGLRRPGPDHVRREELAHRRIRRRHRRHVVRCRLRRGVGLLRWLGRRAS